MWPFSKIKKLEEELSKKRKEIEELKKTRSESQVYELNGLMEDLKLYGYGVLRVTTIPPDNVLIQRSHND